LTDHFQVRVLKTRFSFPHLQSPRQDLFSRRLVTTQRTVLYSRPQSTSDAVVTIDKGTFLESTDMVGSWFKVKPINRTTASDLDSEFVYVDSRNVLVLPREVTFPARYAWLFNSLCKEGQNEDGRDNRCQVFDVRSSLAYGLEFGFQQVEAAEHREGSQTNRGVKRWINSTMVRPGLTMLAEYLMAGLVYYQNREYQEAYHQFLQFVNRIHHRENSENIAIAYQFRGASLYRRRDTGGVSTIPVRADQREEVVEFEEAREVAPYDPSVYNMVAVAQYKIARELNLNKPESESCKNLASVLQRYPQHEQTRALLNHLGCQYAEKDWIQVILHVERILSRKTHSNMPQAVVAGDRPTASPHMQSSRLRLKNNTLLPIRLYYVQAESAARRSADWVPAAGKVELQSGEQQPLNNLSPGTYEVAAEIPNNDKIGTIYGIQEYQAGKDYELSFHMQWRGK
jgi:TolA-binding protein